MHPVLLLVALVAVLLTISWYRRTPGAQQKKLRSRMLLIGGAAILLLLLATGHLNPLFAALAGGLIALQRVFAMAQMANMFKSFKNSVKGAQGPTSGNTSSVETRFLRMTLDHDSGAMSGEVLEGPYRGRRLDRLSLEQLEELLAQCRAEDMQSATVLEAYLERTHGDAWREADEARGGGRTTGEGNGSMSAAEAREILGLGPEASREEIIDAHRRLMQKLHPDRGGSTYLAAKINRAKEVLLEA